MPHRVRRRLRRIEGNLSLTIADATTDVAESDFEGFEGMFLTNLTVAKAVNTPPVQVRIQLTQRSRVYDIIADWIRGPSHSGGFGARWWQGRIPLLRNSIMQLAVRNDTGSSQFVSVDFLLEDL